LRIQKRVQENILNAAMGWFTNKKMAARPSCRIAVEQRRYNTNYAAGMADTQGWQFQTCWTSLHKNWKWT